jgi:hypothetical protein
MWLDQSSKFTPDERLESILRRRDRRGESKVVSKQRSVSRLSRNFNSKELDVPEQRFRRVQKWTHHKLERTQRGREAFKNSSVEPKASYRNVVVDTYRGPIVLDVLQPTCSNYVSDRRGGHRRNQMPGTWAATQQRIIPGVVLVSTLESMRSGSSPLNIDKIMGRKAKGRRTSISCASFSNDYSKQRQNMPTVMGRSAVRTSGTCAGLVRTSETACGLDQHKSTDHKKGESDAGSRRQQNVTKLERLHLLREQQDQRRQASIGIREAQANAALARANMLASPDQSEMVSPWADAGDIDIDDAHSGADQ